MPRALTVPFVSESANGALVGTARAAIGVRSIVDLPPAHPSVGAPGVVAPTA